MKQSNKGGLHQRERHQTDGIARRQADERLTNERADSARYLWMMLGELDTIATEINVVRMSLSPRENDPALKAANEVQIATERLLDLVGELLEPPENRPHRGKGGSA